MRIYLVVGLILITLSTTAHAQQVDDPYILDDSQIQSLPVQPSKEKTTEQEFIQTNIDVSNWFDSLTEGIDLFFVGKKITKEKNQSSFKVENTSTSTEGENFSNVTSLSIRPRFQNLEQYFQLKFTTYDEADEKRKAERGYLRRKTRDQNYGATLGFFRKLGRVKTTFQPRIELQDPLMVSHSLGFESVADYKYWAFNPKLELFANASKGAGIFQAYNFNIPINTTFSLTLINDGEYLDKLHSFSVTNGFALNQAVTEKSGLAYSMLFNSINRPVYYMTDYTTLITWHQIIYKNILDYQVTPNINFDKKRDFKGRAGIILNIGINF